MSTINLASSFIKQFDIFGKDVPSFSLGGRTTVKTQPGAILSIIILSLTLLFALMKLQHLFEKKNALINTNLDAMADDTTYQTNSGDLMLAVTAENYLTGEGVSDPRYVRWQTGLWQRVNDELVITWYPMHKCSDHEYAKFYEPDNNNTKKKFEKLRNEGHIYCIDEKAAELELYGDEQSGVDYTAMDIILMPCAT